SGGVASPAESPMISDGSCRLSSAAKASSRQSDSLSRFIVGLADHDRPRDRWGGVLRRSQRGSGALLTRFDAEGSSERWRERSVEWYSASSFRADAFQS